MTDFLKLAAGLAIYNNGTYNGYRIGKASWQLLGDIQTTKSRIKTERDYFVEVEVTGYNREQSVTGSLTVVMLGTAFKPGAGKKKMELLYGSGYYVLEERQVKSYLEKVQDTNPIHQGRKAVIPGLMLVDYILQLGVLRKTKGKHTIRFREPLWAGTPFTIVSDEEVFRMVSPDGTICYAEID